METDLDHVHLLISYDTTVTVSDIIKRLKQETTYYISQKHYKFLIKKYWKKKIFWSNGYFACSIKEVSSATIQKYIEKCETSSHHLKVVGFRLKYLYEVTVHSFHTLILLLSYGAHWNSPCHHFQLETIFFL